MLTARPQRDMTSQSTALISLLNQASRRRHADCSENKWEDYNFPGILIGSIIMQRSHRYPLEMKQAHVCVLSVLAAVHHLVDQKGQGVRCAVVPPMLRCKWPPSPKGGLRSVDTSFTVQASYVLWTFTADGYCTDSSI